MKTTAITRVISLGFFLIISALACSSSTSDSGSLVEPASDQAEDNLEDNPTETGPVFLLLGIW